ncbi:MAG: alpha-2-macroglobulin domain protein, partial [Herminiimonas sp.]|nr:alpha-2-macroglobulin domain protein [Herminiimonas sp.]
GMGPLPERDLPDRLRIIHRGSAQEFRFPLAWHGQRAAHSEFVIPQQAKLGHYDVVLDSGPIEHSAANGGPADSTRQRYSSGSFRVEEFRLPLLQGRVTPPSRLLVMPNEIPFDVQLNYLNGGGAAGQAVNITSLLRTRSLKYPGYDGFSFQSGQDVEGNEQKIVADKLPVKLDGNGSGKTVVKGLPAIKAPKELLTEMTYADPNGEIQTVSHLTPLWPAAVVVGLRSGGWIAVRGQLSLTAVALDPAGRPQAGVPIEISGVAKQDNTYRKRLVGGFYAYENNSTSKPLGPLCSGKSDARGLLHCMVDLKESGNIDFTATARDKEGHTSEASESVWYSGNGDIWFGGENQDLIDILPEKKKYEPGEVAKFQVRMPFRNATALVAVEREGIIETRVMALNGRDPTISLPIRADYAPNVYVSVLAVRERLREVPWYSFFRWGWKQPVDWWSDFRENRAPGATIDLAKPAFKLGVAEIAVGARAHQLDVKVVADQSSYPIRGTAKITVQVKLPDGRPAAGAEFALAAVDEALLELQPNSSWDLLNAMLQRRSYGVETATAQMQVIGKRHYGRKAIPAGGGGGQSPTRSIVDTLLLWKPAVMLDANGRAQVEVPLNDSLTSFRIVAVANSGAGMFGSGSVTVRSTQDLQLISGLPPLVREGDQFNAMVTIRNTTARSMQVDVTARVAGMAPQPAPQTVMLVAGAVRELAWQAMAPAFSRDGMRQLVWEFAAQERGGAAVRDALRVTQRMASAVPVTVRQASLFQLEQSTSLDLTQPSGGIAGSGGIALTLAPSLVGGMAGVQRYFESYPYTCLEQKASRAIGLRDKALWSRVVAELPAYLDTD